MIIERNILNFFTFLLINLAKNKDNTAKRKYGLGVGSNSGWINHTGSLPGYNCVVAYLPEKQAVFVVMINSDMDLVIKEKNVPLTDMVFEAVTKIVTPDNVPIR